MQMVIDKKEKAEGEGILNMLKEMTPEDQARMQVFMQGVKFGSRLEVLSEGKESENG